MFDQFLKKADELLRKGEPFAVALVVRCETPISGKPGDKAIILASGELWGWVGGGCAQPAVIAEALQALNDGQPRLVRIGQSSSQEEGFVTYNMNCQSGGTLDIYIEPVLPKPHILILGRSPIAQTLAKLAKTINYTVSVAAPQAGPGSFPDADRVQDDLNLSNLKIGPQTYIVVSTQGECDEEAVESALQTDASYVAFVASKPKAAKILEHLRGRGIESARLDQLRAPAGLDLHAGSQEEIAVSILAEIVQICRNTTSKQQSLPPAPDPKQTAIDPICGMSVDAGTAKYKSEYEGRCFYFCCNGCKQTFEKHPEKFAIASVSV
jgi:xanthine dehydrogenase accessory factor